MLNAIEDKCFERFHQVLRKMKYRVILQQNEEGYAINCPGLPGCWSQGKTEEEALENIKDAIETYLATVEDLSREKSVRMVEVS